MRLKKLKSTKGVTLIALVITIIILIILAGVTISSIMGDDGILTQTDVAESKTNEAKEIESIELAYNAVYLANGGKKDKITVDQLKARLEKNGVKSVNVTKSDSALKITFSNTGNIYEIINGEIVKTSISLEALESKLAQARDLGQSQSNDVGIGTDGEVVNLDFWDYYFTDDGKSMSLGDGEWCSKYGRI